MADPIATVETIVKIAVTISKAVGKAQRNIDNCKDIQTLVATASGTVKVLKEKGVMDKIPELSDALGHLKKTLRHALSVVRDCQKDKKFLQHVFVAEDLSNQLGQVKEDIMQKTTTAIFAINAYMAANTADHACHHLKHHQNVRPKTPTDKKAKTPTDKKDKMPADKKAKTPADKKDKTPADKKANTPADKMAKTPADKKDKTLVDKKDKTPADKKDKTPADKKAKTPADNKHKTPSEKAKTPADKKDKTPVDKKAKTPADNKDKTPAEKAKTPADKKDKTLVDKKAKTPADKKAKAPADKTTHDHKTKTPREH